MINTTNAHNSFILLRWALAATVHALLLAQARAKNAKGGLRICAYIYIYMYVDVCISLSLSLYIYIYIMLHCIISSWHLQPNYIFLQAVAQPLARQSDLMWHKWYVLGNGNVTRTRPQKGLLYHDVFCEPPILPILTLRIVRAFLFGGKTNTTNNQTSNTKQNVPFSSGPGHGCWRSPCSPEHPGRSSELEHWAQPLGLNCRRVFWGWYKQWFLDFSPSLRTLRIELMRTDCASRVLAADVP